MADLYNSKVGIPSFRRTAPQLNPGIARMYIGKGAQQMGEAIFEVGEKMHQVNVARQVATAMAQYKMKEADFLASMQNADPSKVNFTEEYNKFFQAQGGLTQGVSRDASNLISNRIKGMGASTYGNVKRMETRNQTNMVLAEAPEILENLVREQAEAELVGDKDRAAGAEADWKAWLAGVAPALPPGVAIKLKNAYGDALDDARGESQIQMVYANILAGNTDGAEAAIPGLSHVTPRQKVSLMKAAAAKKAHRVKQSSVIKAKVQNEQSSALLDEYIETGSITVAPDTDPDLQLHVDALHDRIASGTTDTIDDDINYSFLDHKINDLMTPVSETTLLEASLVLSRDQITQLRKENNLTVKLQPKKEMVKKVIAQISALNKEAMKYATAFDDPAVARILLRELEDEYHMVVQSTKEQFAAGDDPFQIAAAVSKIYEANKEGIIERRWFRSVFASPYHEGDTTLKQRRRAMMNLLMSENHEREVEAFVNAGYFRLPSAIEAAKSAAAPVSQPLTSTRYVPFAADGKFWAAPIVGGQTEADAILSGFDTGGMKEFSSIEEVEKFTGSKLR